MSLAIHVTRSIAYRGLPSASTSPVARRLSTIAQSGVCLTEIDVCAASGTYIVSWNVACLALSFGARTTYATRADVSAFPCGCSRLTVAWPLASGVRTTAVAVNASAAAIALFFIRRTPLAFSLREKSIYSDGAARMANVTLNGRHFLTSFPFFAFVT